MDSHTYLGTKTNENGGQSAAGRPKAAIILDMADTDPRQPIFFESNRVWRCYTGGRLLDRFMGNDNPSDGHFPEDWLGATVKAMNGEHSQGPNEGLSRIRGSDILFSDLLRANPKPYLGHDAKGAELAILCKYLDSAVRLPIQCHPDVAFAREHYLSDRGKTEAWAILDTRTIGGVEPYLLIGFKPGIRPEAFEQAVEQQDVKAMEEMLHKVPAKPGDVWLIPGRLPHAIGPGVFLLEIQEPSDWVVQPEAKCADTCLTQTDMWGPLTPEAGLTCFEYQGSTVDELKARTLMAPAATKIEPGGRIDSLISLAQTDRFSLERIAVSGSIDVKLDSPYCLQAVVQGHGSMSANGKDYSVTKGDVCFLPSGIRHVRYAAKAGTLEIYLCKPPLP